MLYFQRDSQINSNSSIEMRMGITFSSHTFPALAFEEMLKIMVIVGSK